MPAPRVPKAKAKAKAKAKTGLVKAAASSNDTNKIKKIVEKAKENVEVLLAQMDDDCTGENGSSITIDGITFTIICKSEQDDEIYYYPESVTSGSCDTRAQHTDAIHRGSKCSNVGTYNARDMVCFISSALPGVYLYAYRSSSELGIWRLAYLRYGDCGLFKGKLDYVQGTLIHHCLMKLINNKWNDIPLATTIIPTLVSKPCHATHKSGKYCLVSPFITPDIEGMIDGSDRCRQTTIFDRLSITCANQNKDGLSTIWGNLIAFGNLLESSSKFQLNNSRVINRYDFTEKYAGIRAKINICSVEMGNEYVLIYCKYEATYNRKTVKGCYGIALLSSNYSVSPYGIYNCYVKANIFICKPFFYTSMCSYKDSHEFLLCEKEYLYAGFIFECWPYTQLGPFSYENAELKGIIDTLRLEAQSVADGKPKDYGLFTASIASLSSNVPTVFASAVTSLKRVLSNVPSLMGGNKSHKKRNTHKKRKTQKRPYSIFKSNK